MSCCYPHCDCDTREACTEREAPRLRTLKAVVIRRVEDHSRGLVLVSTVAIEAFAEDADDESCSCEMCR
jgi:hypothetical protein